MQTVFLIIILVAVIPVGWWCIKVLLALMVSPERSGLLFLKQELKKLGVDVARIPDSALNEVVQKSIIAAQGIAELYAGSRLQNAREHKNWRANMVRQLEAQAYAIREVMSDSPANPLNEPTQEILSRNGVV